MDTPSGYPEACRYCNDTGWFYTEPDLGACGCVHGDARIEERKRMNNAGMNVRYRKRLMDQVKQRLAALASEQPLRDDDTDIVSCLVCCHFDEPNAACRKSQYYALGDRRACPPPRVIAFGCSDFADIDDIPF